MGEPVKKGAPVVGVVFLILGFVKMAQGEDWVVWFVLGIVFGGLGIFGMRANGKGDA